MYLEYGLANQVELSEGTAELTISSRNAFTYKSGTDNSVSQNMGKADREWEVEGGPISMDDLAKIKTSVDSTAAVHFRADITLNADVHVFIVSCRVKRSAESVATAALLNTTKNMRVRMTLRESA